MLGIGAWYLTSDGRDVTSAGSAKSTTTAAGYRRHVTENYGAQTILPIT